MVGSSLRDDEVVGDNEATGLRQGQSAHVGGESIVVNKAVAVKYRKYFRR